MLGARQVSYTLAGTPKTVSGSRIYVEAQIFYDDNGFLPASGAITTNVTAFFSEGEGQDLQPTTWVRTFDPVNLIYVNSFQTLIVGPGALREAIGYNHSSSPTWLFFWDWPFPGIARTTAPTGFPSQGGNNPGFPLLIVPIPGAPASPGVDPYFSFDAIESKINFTFGLAYSCSSTGDGYMYDNTALVNVEAELYQGDETLSGL